MSIMQTNEPDNSDKIGSMIMESILSNRLNPGAKLPEIALQQEFGFSRNIIRESFAKLVNTGVLTHEKNQGVRVAYPNEQQTREIFVARKAIEQGIIKILVTKHINNQLNLLDIERLITQEEELHQNKQQAKLTHMSCGFHLSLSKLCGNKYLVNSLKPLIPLSVLAAMVYAKQDSNYCSFAEHQKLILAIKSKDLNLALNTSNNHLDNCVSSLDFSHKSYNTNNYHNINLRVKDE